MKQKQKKIKTKKQQDTKVASGWGLIPLDRKTAKFVAEDIELEYAVEQVDFQRETKQKRTKLAKAQVYPSASASKFRGRGRCGL